jgi:rhodopsin domain-containing protein
MLTLKLSLGVFFYRIMILRWQRISVYVILSLSTVTGFAYFLFVISWCGFPVSGKTYWPRLLAGQCIGPKPLLGMSYTHAVLQAATDLSLAALPIPMLIKSRIRKNEKWVVVGIFVIATM